MSFRLKTIFGVALIEVTLLVVLVWNSMDLMRRSGEEQLIQRAETTSRLFASMVKDAVLSYDLATLETFVSELMKNKGLVYVRVYDQDQLLASGGDSTQLARPFEPDHSLGSATDAVFDIDADIIESEQLYGRVEVGLNTKQLEQKLEAATWKASSLAMVEIVLSALFSFLLGSWLVRQLELLRHASSEIANTVSWGCRSQSKAVTRSLKQHNTSIKCLWPCSTQPMNSIDSTPHWKDRL